MQQSERLQRYTQNHEDEIEKDASDRAFCKRIIAFLNDPRITEYCFVDALYYDFSVIPHQIQQDLQLWRDQYFIFGISEEGEFVSKWVERWDLDSDYIIEAGKITEKKEVREGRVYTTTIPPEVSSLFDKNLLSIPFPNIPNTGNVMTFKRFDA